jgi:hypothetical protein
MDVVYVLERTAHVGAANWTTLLKFIVSAITYNTYGSSGARYGLIVFGNGPTNIFFLNNGAADRATLATLIQQTPYVADTGANLYDALVMLRTAAVYCCQRRQTKCTQRCSYHHHKCSSRQHDRGRSQQCQGG